MSEMDYSIYSAMQEGKPLASYKKTTLGMVKVVVLNPFTDTPEEVILSGDPNKKEDLDNLVVDIWDAKAKSFFENVNKYHLKKGHIIPYEREDDTEPEKNYNAVTDEEIEELLNGRFFALKKALDSITEENTLVRFLKKAEETDKSVKIIQNIQDRLVALQRGE